MTSNKLPCASRGKARAIALLLIGQLFLSLGLPTRNTARANTSDGGPSFPAATFSAPALLNHEELISVYNPNCPPAALLPKLNTLLSTPFLSNMAISPQGGTDLSRSDVLGEFIRVGLCNIQRGMGIEK